MRGEQRAFSADVIDVEYECVTYAVVLGLVTAFIALVVMSVFVLDWFVLPGMFGGTTSIDLWSVTACDQGLGCMSMPLESWKVPRALVGLGEYRAFAVTTLWLTVVAVLPVLAQTGNYLLGRATGKHISAIGYVTGTLAIGSAFATAYVTHPTLGGAAMTVHAAPFALMCGFTIGMIALRIATRHERRWLARERAVRIPSARIVR